MIDEQAVHTVFQPVVHLPTGSVAGFEALSRGPAGSALASPLALIAAANQADRLGELDWLCRTTAMQAAADSRLPEGLSWLINVEPSGLAIECPAHLLPALARARSELRVILEVVERDVQGNVLELIRATDQARRDAWGVALDDVGAEEGSLALLPFLRPDVVKLDMSLVRGVPNEAAATITAAVRAYAEGTGAVILAEGIETQEHERLARVFGATYGQGYYYGKPGPLPVEVEAPSHPIPLVQHMNPLDGRTPFEALETRIAPQRAGKSHLLHISAYLENQAAQSTHASVVLAGFQNKTYFTVARQDRYRHLADNNALTIVLAQDLPRYDEPAYHIGPLPEGSGLSNEWVVVVLNPHFAAAFVARECSDRDIQGHRQFDFVYTFSRDAVIDAARCLLQDLTQNPGRRSSPPRTAALAPGSEPIALELASRNGRAITVGSGAVGNRQTIQEPDLPTLSTTIGTVFSGFRAASELVLDYLNENMPLAFWSITRVENDRQTYLYLRDNDYGLTVGGSHPWQDSYCVHMVAGTAPRIAPDSRTIPAYAGAAVNQSVQIGAYAGAPIAEPDGSLFGAICGLDRVPRDTIADFGPTLNLLSELLTNTLATDRALQAAQQASNAALTCATTEPLTGLPNRRAWDQAITRLDQEYTTYADPTVIVLIDLDRLTTVNDGPGGHTAGDRLIREAAHIMKRNLRGHDFLARLGGDEFGIILVNTSASLAPNIAARLTKALGRAAVPCSVGWSPHLPDGTIHRTIELADQAMYRDKHQRKGSGARVALSHPLLLNAAKRADSGPCGEIRTAG